MKKELLTLGLAGLCLTAISQEKINPRDVFREVSISKIFEIKKYKSYITHSMTFPIDGKTYISFDLNKDGKMDIMATIDTPTSKYASRIGFDLNGDKKYEIMFGDEDGDGYLDIVKLP